MSRPYKPGAKCCEACCFGRGEHAEWCILSILQSRISSAVQELNDIAFRHMVYDYAPEQHVQE